MSESFQVSDDFAEFEAEHQTAIEEAGKAEKMVMGINIPTGTRGVACVLSMVSGRSKIKINPKTKEQSGNNPMVTVSFMVETPEAHVGQKANLYFTFNQTKTSTVQQKYQRFYDTMLDCGMPEELRGKPLAEIFKWFGAESRKFNYEIVPHWSNPAEKEFKPQGKVGSLPDQKDIQAAMSQQQFSVGDKVKAAGNACEIVSVTGDSAKVRFESGQEMNVPVANLTK